MRKVGWALVVLLFVASAAFFLRYVSIDGQHADSEIARALRQIAAFAHLSPSTSASASVQAMRHQADFSLYTSIATGLLATLVLILLAATGRSRRRVYDVEDADDAGNVASLQSCPECYEPIKGFELSCRACGYRFGPRFGPR